MAKSPNAFRTISEAADEVGAPQHVLRFWETKFSFITPLKRAGGRRVHRVDQQAGIGQFAQRREGARVPVRQDAQKTVEQNTADAVAQVPCQAQPRARQAHLDVAGALFRGFTVHCHAGIAHARFSSLFDFSFDGGIPPDLGDKAWSRPLH